ncbi:MAG: hypothetical protein PHS62_00305 [Patescibacteria group bacterium]|nr:hypothetical protein [Patescibacteria group bacterium]
MSKNIQMVIKIILIFIASTIIAWFTRKIFGDLYVVAMRPEAISPNLFIIGPNLIYFFVCFIIFFYIHRQKILVVPVDYSCTVVNYQLGNVGHVCVVCSFFRAWLAFSPRRVVGL